MSTRYPALVRRAAGAVAAVLVPVGYLVGAVAAPLRRKEIPAGDIEDQYRALVDQAAALGPEGIDEFSRWFRPIAQAAARSEWADPLGLAPEVVDDLRLALGRRGSTTRPGGPIA